ncbi:hypothetical protein PoB_007034500 [Plakobranchus ocellatus]|uniref:Uncharacterized protein n=1 Tax=Plakobranchus ocellatus TaxID=259542 RepID=A0AAV4DI77_9GAST|nr:hypothetical protein PoB_007034500 [Plakobranchus ocellatus]
MNAQDALVYTEENKFTKFRPRDPRWSHILDLYQYLNLPAGFAANELFSCNGPRFVEITGLFSSRVRCQLVMWHDAGECSLAYSDSGDAWSLRTLQLMAGEDELGFSVFSLSRLWSMK